MDNSATAGSDYVASNGTLLFAPGVTSRTIIVPTIDDSEIESTENFTVNLSNVTGGAVILDSQSVGTIVDDEATREMTISDATVTEGDSSYRFVDELVPPTRAFTIPPTDLVQDEPDVISMQRPLSP